MSKQVNYFDRVIYLDEIYFVAFYDKPREMTNKQLESYRKIKSFPQQLQTKELYKLNPLDNPALTPMTGRELCNLTREKNYIPQFDPFFDKPHQNKYIAHNRKLVLMPADAVDFYSIYSKALNS